MTPLLKGAATASVAALLLATAPAAWAAAPRHAGDAPAVVTTDNETPVLYDDEAGGNAVGDDPAIWVHPGESDESIVIVTAKEGGLRVYDLESDELQSLPATVAPRADGTEGRYNNVDIAYGVELDGERVDVAVVSDRYNDQLRFFTIDPAGTEAETPLVEVTAAEQPFLFSADRATVDEGHTAYGLAMWQPAGGGDAYAVVTQEGATTLATARIVEIDGALGYADVATTDMPASFPLPDGTTWTPCDEPGIEPHLEGLTVDQRTGVLYAAQEDVGLWRLQLPFGAAEPRLIDRVKDFGVHDAYDPETEECAPVDAGDEGFGGPVLEADAEGVDLYYGPGATGYLIVSSQGDDTFAVYERQGRNRLVGTFRVDGVEGADEINGSDGLAVTNRVVGDYREGLLVTHDEPETGEGVDGDRDATNFSYVDWDDIAEALQLKVSTAAGNDPRFR
ncbi:phytase [Agromyces cerinus]|uniref:3-phytase n=1 Tax=Agromyces cerinus subsp. cerinus TaxID=232089 RepID=A0A1N6ICF6_9MICO|nr:phytase [Agromyces cerinus]SIO29710.1 3-phytase [Agromyces cerinus subsp. cerinus]